MDPHVSTDLQFTNTNEHNVRKMIIYVSFLGIHAIGIMIGIAAAMYIISLGYNYIGLSIAVVIAVILMDLIILIIYECKKSKSSEEQSLIDRTRV